MTIVSRRRSAQALSLLLLSSSVVACATADEMHVYNRTNAVLQLGFAAPVAACSDASLPLAEVNDPDLPPLEGAWRPTTGVAVAIGDPEPTHVLVTRRGTQWLFAAPEQLGPCEGFPVDWAQ